MKGVNGKQRPQALLATLPPRHCAPLPPSVPTSAHQLQDLAESPGDRWKVYRLRVDRPGGGGHKEFRGGAGAGVTPRQTHRAVRPGRGVLGNSCPTNPRRVHELTADGAAESSLLFVGFPSSGKGQTEEFGWTRMGSRFREAPSAGLISRTARGTWIRERSIQEASCFCSGVRQEVLPAGWGRDLTLLGRGTVTGSWETALMGLGSSE